MPLLNKRELRKFRENYIRWDGAAFCEGLKLAVHFDEKEHVKSLGAKWQPDPSGRGGYWWIPTHKLDDPMPEHMDPIVNVFEAREADVGDGGAVGTCLCWLNDNKMVNGLYGNVDQAAALEAVVGQACAEYMVRGQRDVHDPARGHSGTYSHFYVYESINLVNWVQNGDQPGSSYKFMTLDNSRELWDSLMEQGYRPVSDNSA